MPKPVRFRLFSHQLGLVIDGPNSLGNRRKSNDSTIAATVQNSVMLPDSEVLATAYSDKEIDPKNTGKHEPVVWVATYGKGRVVENVMVLGVG